MTLTKKVLMYEREKCVSKLEDLKIGTDEYDKCLLAVNDLSEAIKSLDEEDSIDIWIERVKIILETMAAIGVPVGIAIISINFEKYGTITTEAGRNALRACFNLFSKKR